MNMFLSEIYYNVTGGNINSPRYVSFSIVAYEYKASIAECVSMHNQNNSIMQQLFPERERTQREIDEIYQFTRLNFI